MKTIILTMTLMTAVSLNLWAKTTISCDNRFENPEGPVIGHYLSITQENNGEIKGVMYPICPACMVMPTEIKFDKLEEAGMSLIVEGKTHRLEVTLESFAPTTHHWSTFTDLENNTQENYSCEITEE